MRNWARILLIAGCLAYYLALSVSYATVESQLFTSLGVEYYPPSLPFQLLAAVMAVLPSLWLPVTVRHPSQVCIWILYTTVVVPMMFVPYHVLDAPESEIVVLPLTIFFLFVLLQLGLKLPLARLPRVSVNRKTVYWCVQVSLLAATLIAMAVNGTLRLNFSLDDVYVRRLEAREIIGSGSLTAYTMGTLSYALAPLALLLGYTRRRPLMVVTAIFAFLCVYSCRATKADLFMPLFLVGMCVCLRSRKLPFGLAVISIALLLVLASMAEFFVLGTSQISSYLIRRQLMVPSLLTSYYWEFFSHQPLIYFADKFYGSYFAASSYDLPLARLIGFEYFGNGEINANTCFWASAFANLGYLGMLLFTVLLAFVLRMLDSVAVNGEVVIAAAVAGLFGVQLSNGSLESCMITGGVAVSFLVLMCLRDGSPRPIVRRTLPAKPAVLCRKEAARSWTH